MGENAAYGLFPHSAPIPCAASRVTNHLSPAGGAENRPRRPGAASRAVFAALAAAGLAPLAALGFYDDAPPETLAPALVAAMSDEEALAQTFMLGWRDTAEGPSAVIEEWIRRRRVGGVKVFGWNTGDIRRLARNIGGFQRLAAAAGGVPLLVATDQEGGLVRHVKDGASETPGAMATGASGFPEDAYRSGFYIGRELSVIGINMNFAPAVDLFTNHDSTLIGTRSFGDNPVKTGVMAAAFARGQLAAGVIPTAKHFPGHGDTALDSHGGLPKIGVSFETLWERELVPYRMLVKEKIPAVMSGHIAFPNTDAKNTPASLSPFFIRGALREKMGFDGVVITDDLAMNGATMSAGSLSAAAKQALLAGNDIVMISQTPSLDAPVWTTLAEAMRREPEFRARVRDAARRALAVKLRYLRGEGAVPAVPDMEKVRRALPDKEGLRFYQDLAARAVTVARNAARALPLSPEKAGRVLLAGQSADFFDTGRLAYPGSPRIWCDLKFWSDFLRLAREADTVIFCLEKNEDLAFLSALRPLRKRVVVLSVLSPAHLKSLDWVDAAVAVYSDSRESLVAGFSAISGGITPQGTLPFAPK